MRTETNERRPRRTWPAWLPRPVLGLVLGLVLAGCATDKEGRDGNGNPLVGGPDVPPASAGASATRGSGARPDQPVPGSLVAAPRLSVDQRIARRLNGPPDPAAQATSAAAGTPGAKPSAAGRKRIENAGPPDSAYEIDLELPRYRPGTNLQGVVRTVGSSTLTTLFSTWSDDFERMQGRIRLQITGGGSSAAVAPLVAGQSDLAPMAREMTAREIEGFKARWGYAPTRLTVALDAIAVFVHKDNPLKMLTLAQLESIYAIEPRQGIASPQTWRDLGVGGPLAGQPVRRYGPQRSQGIYSVFRSQVLGGAEYVLSMQSEPVSSAVVQAAGADEAGIAFSSRMFATLRTRAVPIASTSAEPAGLPTARNIAEGRYPLARRLYVYVNKGPNRPLPPQVTEFLRYVCSYEGQERLAQSGGIALTREISEAECAGRL